MLLCICSCKQNLDLTSPESVKVIVEKIIDSVEVQIKYGQEALIENNITIKFKSVTDSRCPLNVRCFWEGDGSCGLQFSDSGEQLHTFLHTTLFPREINFSGYRIILKSLTPYPESANSINLEQYNAILIIAH